MIFRVLSKLSLRLLASIDYPPMLLEKRKNLFTVHIWLWASITLFCRKSRTMPLHLLVLLFLIVHWCWHNSYFMWCIHTIFFMIVCIFFIGLRAIKLLATYLSEPSSREVAKLQIEEWLADPAATNNSTVRLVAAILYMHDDNSKEAIKNVRHERTLEQ